MVVLTLGPSSVTALGRALGVLEGSLQPRPLERLLGFWVPRRCRIHPPRRLLQLFALEPAGVALGSRLPPPGVDGGGR